MSESIYKNDELVYEVSLDMSYFWYLDDWSSPLLIYWQNRRMMRVMTMKKEIIGWTF